MILVIDNHDSFTWNLVQYLRELGTAVEVIRNDGLTAAEVMSTPAAGILISPGPGRPEDAGISLEVVEACAATERPLLGVCLGHQAVGLHFGGKVVRAPSPMHGKTDLVAHDGSGVFADLANPFTATRYHSLVVDRATLPDCLLAIGWAEDDTIQGLRHRQLPIHGVQFHPESIASQFGHELLANFLNIASSRSRSIA